MDMEHSLSCRGIAVEDRAVAVLRMTSLARYLLRYEVHFAYHLTVFWL